MDEIINEMPAQVEKVEVVDIQFRPGQKIYFFDPDGVTYNPGDHVITTALEHNSVFRPLFELEDRGVELTVLPADLLGNIRYEDFEKEIRGKECTEPCND